MKGFKSKDYRPLCETTIRSSNTTMTLASVKVRRISDAAIHDRKSAEDTTRGRNPFFRQHGENSNGLNFDEIFKTKTEEDEIPTATIEKKLLIFQTLVIENGPQVVSLVGLCAEKASLVITTTRMHINTQTPLHQISLFNCNM